MTRLSQRWLLAATLTLAAGCQQKMAQQPSYQPDDPCAFFADGTSSRKPVAGTVARGHLNTDLALHTGRIPGAALSTSPTTTDNVGVEPLLEAEAARYVGLVDQFPLPVDQRLVEHGRDRYMIYCTVCHDALGSGQGKIVERGYTRPPSYHVERLRRAPVGHFFRVITEGYGSMPSYAAQIPVRDRWAIVAYVRALQLSQHFPEDQLPPELKEAWQSQEKLAADEGGSP